MLWLWNPGAGVLPGLCISASSDRVSSLCPFLKLICTPEISFLMFACSCYISPTFDTGPPIVAMAEVPPLFALLLLVISSFLLLLNREDDWPPLYGAPPCPAPPPYCLLMLGDMLPGFWDPAPPLRLELRLLNFYYSIIL
jgi:hypothetical protein